MKVLVLGDCASAGTNVLDPEILGQKNTLIKGRVTSDRKYEKDVCLWYLKQTKDKKIPIKNIKRIPYDAINYLREQEVANSYWKYINGPIINMSKVGATAGGYYKRLLKYEKTNGRPDIIVVTDHSPNHMWQVINYKGKQYFFEKNYKPEFPDFYINLNLTAPEQAQYMAYLKARECYERQNTKKRNNRIMTWFLNHLDKNNYRYVKIKFYNGFDEFDHSKECIDCSDLALQYSSDAGEDFYIKINMAPKIANRIQDKWPHRPLTNQ